MHTPESILENEMHKILIDFVMQIIHLIPAKWSGILLIANK